MRRLLAGAAIVLFAVAAGATLVGWARTADPAAVSFKATGTGGLKLEGTTASLNVMDDGKTLTFIVPLKEVTTGIALRDRHMKEKYLQVDKFPEARLDVLLADLNIPKEGTALNGEAKGLFTVHGKTKEVPFKYKGLCRADRTCAADGEIAIDLRDYEIVIPTYLGLTVKPDVVITASFILQRP